MYIRFVVNERHPPFGHRSGFFSTAYELRDHGSISSEELNELKNALAWFSANMERPSRFTRSKNPRATETAISWFKSSARTHIDQARKVLRILNRNGHTVEMIKTSRPGYVVFEDDFQIVAVPFSDTAA